MPDSSWFQPNDAKLYFSKSYSKILNNKNIIIFLGDPLERLASIFVYLKFLSVPEFTRNKTAFSAVKLNVTLTAKWAATTCTPANQFIAKPAVKQRNPFADLPVSQKRGDKR